MQAEFLANPAEQIGQSEQCRRVGAASEGQSLCAGEGFEEESVLGDIACEDLPVEGAIAETADERVGERIGGQVAIVGPQSGGQRHTMEGSRADASGRAPQYLSQLPASERKFR